MKKQAYLAVAATVCLIAAFLMPGLVSAQDEHAQKVKTSMQLLQSEAAKLGAPNIEGTENIAGKEVPAIHFGQTKINNNFDLVDHVTTNAGGTATITSAWQQT
ncbi:MAG: Cache 3/Cache 2 fusion domain-containing protein [Rhodomicrobium sp.]